MPGRPHATVFRKASALPRKLLIMRISILLSSFLFVGTAFGDDSETKVQFKDLPAAVQKAAKQQETNGVTVRGYNREIENGRTFYEVEARENGRTRDILLDEAGTVVEVEQEVAIGKVPVAAMEGLKKEAGGANIQHVEYVTKGGKTSYEAVILKNGKKKEIAVNGDGFAIRE
jgi:uncharacterized membrane protein YkoI